MKPGIPIPVRLSAFKDRTFQFATLTPPTTWFLKKCANIEKGAAKPVLETVGKVTLKQIYEIATIKQTDKHVSHIPIEHICRSIIGTARSMGVEVVHGKEGSAITKRAAANVNAPAAAATATTLGAAKSPASAPNKPSAPKLAGSAAAAAAPVAGGGDKKKTTK